MNAASAELQKAVWNRLVGDAELVALLGGVRVFDTVPVGTPFPYLTFGRETVSDWSTATELGSEHLFSLHVWSRERGRKEVQAITAHVQALLHEASLVLAGYRLVNLRFRGGEQGFVDELRVVQGTLRFRAVTEPA